MAKGSVGKGSVGFKGAEEDREISVDVGVAVFGIGDAGIIGESRADDKEASFECPEGCIEEPQNQSG